MSKTLSIVKNYVDTHDGAVVAFTNSNKVLTGIPVKEIQIYFDLPVDDDGSGTPTKDSVDEVLPVIEAILETDEQILSLSYDMYNMNVTDSDGDLGHNLTLNVFVSNSEDSHGVNTLGEAEFHLDHRTEYVTLEKNGHYYTMQGEIPFTTTVYDVSYDEFTSDEPATDEPTVTPEDTDGKNPGFTPVIDIPEENIKINYDDSGNSYDNYNIEFSSSEGSDSTDKVTNIHIYGVNTINGAFFQKGHTLTLSFRMGMLTDTITTGYIDKSKDTDDGVELVVKEVVDNPTVTPESVPEPLYKVADYLEVHISDTDTVTFTGDDNSTILYSDSGVKLVNVSDLALQHLAKDQFVDVYTTIGDNSGVVYSGYITGFNRSGNTMFIYLSKELPDSDSETSTIEENGVSKGEDSLHLSSEGTIQGKTIQLGNTSISFGDKTARITADKITLEGVTIVQEPHNSAKNKVMDISGTSTLGEFLKGLDGK